MKLYEAIEANDPEAAVKALKRIKNVNREMRDNGYTPLSYAASKNAVEVIPVLLEAGAEPEPDETLHPLYMAAMDGSAEAMAVLLDARQWEPEPVLSALKSAARHGRTECLRLLLDKTGAKPLPAALCNACLTGRLEALNLLLERGGEPNGTDDGSTPMHIAARAGYPDLLKALLDAGGDVNGRDDKGRTPLMQATLEHGSQRFARANYRSTKRDIENPDSEVKIICGTLANPPHARRTIKTLLTAGADPSLVDDNGHTGLDILHQDGRRIDPWLKKRLQSAGAPQVDHWPKRLMQAISKKDVESVRDLTSQSRDVNFKAVRGGTPLCHACRCSSAAVVELILKAGADPNMLGGHEYPVHAAVLSNDPKIMVMVLDAGADPNLAKPGEYSHNALELAKSLGYREIAKLLSDRGAKMPEPKHKLVEPGVHWWDDWELIVVEAEVETIAEALDPDWDSIDMDPIGMTFTCGGKGTYVVVRPTGYAWSNVLCVNPTRGGVNDDFKNVARKLAKVCEARAIYAAYNDTASACEFFCYEPDGTTSIEDHGADMEFADMAVSFAKDEGREPPAWAVQMIEEAEASGEDPPHSTDRLEALAKAEGFALGWAFFSVEPGEQFEVEFTDYPPEAIEAVAFVDAPSWA